MSAGGFIEQLQDSGIRLTRDGGDLIADVVPGADLGIHVERVKANKPKLVAELRLREEIVAAASIDPECFDCDELARL